MNKKTIIFVDANNWYHNIKYWFKPSNIDITQVSNLISDLKNLDILEICWYVSMPSIKDNPLTYKIQRAFLGHLQKKGIKIITRKLQKLSNKELLKKRQDLLGSLDLCEKCKPIVEESFLNISDYNQKEKGIDVWIAVDMVKETINDKIDCAVLISGDADFVPALNLVREVGKEVLSVFIPRGYSNELRQKFPFLVLKKDDLIKCLRDYKEIREDKNAENQENKKEVNH